jgi:nitroreductase
MSSAPVAASALISALNWRYATKQFDPSRKIPAGDWQALEEALRLAPSSFGIQPWKFVVVESPELRARLREASWGQTQVTDASHLVVLVVKQAVDGEHLDRYFADTSRTRGVSVESLAGYRKLIDGFVSARAAAGQLEQWSAKQVYIAAGQCMAAAAMMGIDTCPLEGIDPAKYDELLGLSGTGWATQMAIAAGYRAAGDKYAVAPKVRFPAAEVIERR